MNYTKNITLSLMSFFAIGASAQKTIDLSRLKFGEPAAKVLPAAGNAATGMMFDLPDMLSYGIDNSGHYSYGYYQPAHIELLAYQGKVAGYAFRISSDQDQLKIKALLEEEYRGIKMIDSSRWGKAYQYSDGQITIDFKTVPAAAFKQGGHGSLDIKTNTLIKAINEQEAKYKRMKPPAHP